MTEAIMSTWGISSFSKGDSSLASQDSSLFQSSSAGTSKLGSSKRKHVDLEQVSTTAPKKRKKEAAKDGAVKANKSTFEFFPVPASKSTVLPSNPIPSTSHNSSNVKADSLHLMPIHDTPIIEKNREMRAEADKRRKTARSTRGKRASSSLGSGVLAQPHASVPTSSFYKHLPPDLPEAHRARHLLVWCGSRAAATTGRPPDPTLPELTPHDAQILKEIQSQVLKSLAEGAIDTNVLSKKDGKPAPPATNMKPHEQNVKNRKREKDFTAEIERAKTEDAAWAELIQRYNAQQANAIASISQREEQPTPKGKGKAKATDAQQWEPWDNELDEPWRQGASLARELVQAAKQPSSSQNSGPLDERLKGVQWQADKLHADVHTASLMADHVRLKLDSIYTELSATLQARSASLPSVPPSTEPSMSKLTTTTAAPPDPLPILRGIARLDANRPESAVSEPAHRTRRSVATADGAPPAAKYSSVAGATPRRQTPKKTPRKGR